MVDFWDALTGFISNYTIYDTASLFSIIEGLATVVAAVGAIIAVVVTKKIAKEQIEIAKRQTEISSAQAEISKQQNKIALFKERYETLQHINYFFYAWNATLAIYKPMPKNIEEMVAAYKESDLFMSRYYVDDYSDTRIDDVSDFNINTSASFYMRNRYHFKRVYKLFRLSPSELEYIKKIEGGYYAISTVVSLKNAEFSPSFKKFEANINEFFVLIMRKDIFLKSIEQQVDVFDCV